MASESRNAASSAAVSHVMDAPDPVFEPATPPRAAEPPVVKVDLGCGAVKRDGFLGVDRFAMPGVDIVCDVDEGLPMDDDSVDYMVASHSLEHFKSLPQVMEEVYRVCKDRALVTIIGPYYNTRLNQANPYHIQTFNEHTPRFFTTEPSPAISIDEYAFPFANEWGLGRSDNTQWVADMRLLHAEYLYMPDYRGLDPEIQLILRKTWSDVCDQFSMQLLVVKSPISDAELEARSKHDSWPSTPYYEARKREELEIGPGNALTRLLQGPAPDPRIEALGAAIAELSAQAGLVADLNAAVADLSAQAELVTSLSATIADLGAQAGLVADLGATVTGLNATVTDLSAQAELVAGLSATVADLSAQAGLVANLQNRVDELSTFVNRSARESSEAFARLLARPVEAPAKADAPPTPGATALDMARALRRIEGVEAVASEASLGVRKLETLPDHLIKLVEQSTESRLALARLAGRITELEQGAEGAVAEPLLALTARIDALGEQLADRDRELEALRAETGAALADHAELGDGLARALDQVQAVSERAEATADIVEPLAHFMAQVAGELDEARAELESLPARFADQITDLIEQRGGGASQDALADRITAVNALFTRRVLALELEQENLVGGRGHFWNVLQGEVAHLKERETILTDVIVNQSAYIETALTHLVSARIASERAMFKPLAVARTYLQRGRDLRASLAGGVFSAWLDAPGNGPEAGTRIQLGEYWRPDEGMTFSLGPVAAGLSGVDLAAWTFMPPAFPIDAFAFEVVGADGPALAYGRCQADKNLGVHHPLRLRFAALEHPHADLTVRLHGLPHLSRTGIKFYERRRVQPVTRRLLDTRPLALAVYG